MADDNGNLDKYLEDLGINMGEEDVAPLEEEAQPQPQANTVEVLAPAPTLISGDDTSEQAESFLVNLLLNFDPAYAVEVGQVEDGELRVDIFGGDSGKIIGRGGRTLQALEYVTNTVLNRQEGGNLRVTIDVGGYKRRRDERLRDLARKAANEVRETGQPYPLKPMNAAERRVVHMEIADDPTVISESSGQGRDRKVVVKPS